VQPPFLQRFVEIFVTELEIVFPLAKVNCHSADKGRSYPISQAVVRRRVFFKEVAMKRFFIILASGTFLAGCSPPGSDRGGMGSESDATRGSTVQDRAYRGATNFPGDSGAFTNPVNPGAQSAPSEPRSGARP